MADQVKEPVLESLAEDVKNITTELDRAKSLISVLKEAGEDVSKPESEIRLLEVRKKKWERVLNARGYSTTSEVSP